MKIHVKIFATLRLKLGISEIYIEPDKPLNIMELLQLVNDKVNYDVIPELIENNKVRVGTILLIDGKNVLHMQHLDTIIDKDCEFSIFPPVGGG